MDVKSHKTLLSQWEAMGELSELVVLTTIKLDLLTSNDRYKGAFDIVKWHDYIIIPWKRSSIIQVTWLDFFFRGVKELFYISHDDLCNLNLLFV